MSASEKRVFVGYGRGALAIIDAENNRKLADIELPAHPESFRLENGAERIFVNLPDDRSVTRATALFRARSRCPSAEPRGRLRNRAREDADQRNANLNC
jgi:hypothetical protein